MGAARHRVDDVADDGVGAGVEVELDPSRLAAGLERGVADEGEPGHHRLPAGGVPDIMALNSATIWSAVTVSGMRTITVWWDIATPVLVSFQSCGPAGSGSGETL